MFQKCRAMISLAPLGEPFQRIYFRTMEELLAVGSIECEMKPISKEQVKRLYRGQLALVQIGANHHRSFPHLVTIPVSNFAKSLY